MTFSVSKFLHVGSMFLATALASGRPCSSTSSPVAAIRRAFARATTVFRVSGAFYGVGYLFGFAFALNGQLDPTDSWLVIAYVLVSLLIATNLVFERWTGRIEATVGTPEHERSADLHELIRARASLSALVPITTLTSMVIVVMVVKPIFFG